MMDSNRRLFTPGPLTTSAAVKQAMLVDIGSREDEFISIVAEVRRRLLNVAGVTKEQGFDVIPMQGSGTFGLESVLASLYDATRRVLVISNGAYGRRLHELAEWHGLNADLIEFAEEEIPDLEVVRDRLADGYTDLAAVHCETSTGALNPLYELGQIAHAHGCEFLVDAMSSFGAVPLNVQDAHVDLLVSSANKCLQGVPGFSFVVGRRERLLSSDAQPRSVSLNLPEQLRRLDQDGQFRFTPPTHAVLALRQALIEWEQEGGADGRADRYRSNQQELVGGMRDLGFREFLTPDAQSHIITTFLSPESFDLADFHQRLSDKGMVIYPGQLTTVDSFRIGTIGHLFPKDIKALLGAIRKTLSEMDGGRSNKDVHPANRGTSDTIN